MPPSSQRDRLIGLLEGRNEVGNRFTKLQRLGDGGAAGTFSALLTALDGTTGERVALKFLLPSFAGSYRDDSFGREAALLADLHGKPDIIQLACPRAEFTETLHSDQGISLDVSFSYYGRVDPHMLTILRESVRFKTRYDPAKWAEQPWYILITPARRLTRS